MSSVDVFQYVVYKAVLISLEKGDESTTSMRSLHKQKITFKLSIFI